MALSAFAHIGLKKENFSLISLAIKIIFASRIIIRAPLFVWITIRFTLKMHLPGYCGDMPMTLDTWDVEHFNTNDVTVSGSETSETCNKTFGTQIVKYDIKNSHSDELITSLKVHALSKKSKLESSLLFMMYYEWSVLLKY